MEKIKYPVIIVFLVFALSSCADIKTLPDEPRIEFTSFSVFDTVDILGNSAKGGRLKFYFEDGDGNVGFPAPEPGQENDSTNLFFKLYRMTNGVMAPAPDNDPLKPSDYRIPYMEKTGQNTILQGTISVTFLYLFYFETDTIRYDFYLKDRADNLSNTVSTNPISLFINGVYK
jgi:hypothetical protein